MTFDPLRTQLAMLVVTDENFVDVSREYRKIRRNRRQLREMTGKYPVFIDYGLRRFTLQRPDDVGRLLAGFRAKLKEHYLYGLPTVVEPQPETPEELDLSLGEHYRLWLTEARRPTWIGMSLLLLAALAAMFVHGRELFPLAVLFSMCWLLAQFALWWAVEERAEREQRKRRKRRRRGVYTEDEQEEDRKRVARMDLGEEP